MATWHTEAFEALARILAGEDPAAVRADINARHAAELAELDRRIAKVRAERDRWAAMRQVHEIRSRSQW